jgi:hypothetical protein
MTTDVDKNRQAMAFSENSARFTCGITRDGGHPEPEAKDLCPGVPSKAQHNLSSYTPLTGQRNVPGAMPPPASIGTHHPASIPVMSVPDF